MGRNNFFTFVKILIMAITIKHIVTIQIGSTPETKEFLRILDEWVNKPQKIQEIMDKLDKLNDDIKSTVE